MGRPNGPKLGLAEIFPRVQDQMLAQFALGSLLRHHPTPRGEATEKQWIEFFNRYLPRRYTASSVFVISADGRCSRQIDIAIYDNFYSPMLFPHESGLHIPAESVYAVFEVKQVLSPELMRDAGEKAASVRMLRRTSAPVPCVTGVCPGKAPHNILAGILAVRAAWTSAFSSNVTRVIQGLPDEERLDFGCALLSGSFEALPRGETYSLHFSPTQESLIFFFIRLVERLRSLGTAPAADLMEYARSLTSLSRYHSR